MDLESYRRMPNAFINPDLSQVLGIPPHLWRARGNDIIAMTEKETEKRLKSISTYGAINTLEVVKSKGKALLISTIVVISLSLIGFILALAHIR